MKEQLIQYLRSNDVNALATFLHSWLRHKIPNKPHNDIDIFIRVYLDHLLRVPAMFDSRYNDALQQLVNLAMAELHVNCVLDRNNKIIKYY